MSSEPIELPIVVKVGGSLFDWPELKPRLQQFLAALGDRFIILVPGGGQAANVVRELDRVHQLGEELSHWLALRALTLTGHLLARLLGVQVVEGLNAARSALRRIKITVIDPYRFASGDDSRTEHLPHCWDATSDSLAARVAHVAEAERLILLKSITIPPSLSWEDCGKQGLVDALFARTIAGGKFAVEWVNLRDR